MKTMYSVICSLALLSGISAVARADDAPADAAAYKQKMHDCVTQMKTDHPDMNHEARRKACHKQMGPAPKAPKAPAAPAAAPAAPPAT